MYKALCLLLLGVLLSSTTTLAQKFQVGLRIGVNNTNLSGTGAEALQLEAIRGGHVGFVAKYALPWRYSFLKADIMYNMKGAKSTNDSIRVNLGYAEVPLTFHLESDRFYAEAGPQLSVRIKNQYTDIGEQTNVDQVVNNIKTISPGYVAGAGMHFGNMTVGLRYSSDFSSIVTAIDNRALRNNVLLLTATFILPSL